MRSFAILSNVLLMPVLAFSIAIGMSVQAQAKKKPVVSASTLHAACRRTPNCRWDVDGRGTGLVCTPNGCGVCTRGKCVSAIKGKTPNKGVIIGGIRLPVGTVQPPSAGGTGGHNGRPIRHPVSTGVTNGPTGVKTPIAVSKRGGMHNGNGGRHR